jgi:hypothetical protein
MKALRQRLAEEWLATSSITKFILACLCIPALLGVAGCVFGA